jgi:hypothetical protein
MRICGQPRHHDSKKQVLIVSSENYDAIATRLGRIPQSGLVQSALCGSPHNAEFERAMLRERTKIGLEAARREGRIGGRRPKLTPQQQSEIKKMVSKAQKTAADAARLFKVHPATIARLLARAYAR